MLTSESEVLIQVVIEQKKKGNGKTGTKVKAAKKNRRKNKK